jgi:hypothetical protein
VKVTTAIHFNHELDLLEAAIVEASHYSDRIVVKEGEANWHGHEKPLHATDNWDRFRKYEKAEVMVIPADEFVKDPINKQFMCLNESRTRTYGWQDVSDSVDYVIECDVDEIIDQRMFPILEQHMAEDYLHIGVRYANFLWYMNNRVGKHRQYRIFKTGEPELCLMPKHRKRIFLQSYLGWHFSGCISGEDWGRKYTDMNLIYGFTNEEIGNYDWDKFRADRTHVDKHRNEVQLHGDMIYEVNLAEYPEFVAEHPELYPWWDQPVFRGRKV